MSQAESGGGWHPSQWPPPTKVATPSDIEVELQAFVDSLGAVQGKEKAWLHGRWMPAVRSSSRKMDNNKRGYYGWRLPAAVGAVVLPPLTTPTIDAAWLRWAALVVSLVVAVSTAVDGWYRFGNRWRLYRTLHDDLRSEAWNYRFRLPPYDGQGLPAGDGSPPDDGGDFTLFVTRSEGVLRRYGEEYVADLVLISRSKAADGGHDDVNGDQQGG